MLARTLLVWFVLLAVPFQGYAAAAMACAHGVGQPERVTTPPCHGSAQKADADSQAGHKKYGNCGGNCAACSVGPAIAPALPDTGGSERPRGPRPASTPAPIAAVDPDLPDRPPRHRLA